MNKIIIRKASKIDAEGITLLHDKVWKSSYRGIFPDEWLDKPLDVIKASIIRRKKKIEIDIENNWPNIVAISNNQIIGWIAGGLNNDNNYPYDAELNAIYILKDFQYQGIGKVLVKSFVDLVKYNQLTSMILWVLKANSNAIKFYHRLGGKLVGEKKYKNKFPIVGYAWDDINLINEILSNVKN